MTLVSHRKQFIFLKTHKTASTSVEAALDTFCAPDDAETGAHKRSLAITPDGIIGERRKGTRALWRPHMSAPRVRTLLGRSVFERYAKITTVRNPYSRMVSLFHFTRDIDHERIAGAPFREVQQTFRDWVQSKGPSHNLGKLTIKGRYIIDHVLFFERITEDFGALAEALGRSDLTLPRYKMGYNKRPEPWRDYYDDRSRAAVARQSAFELAFFGYAFESDAANPPSLLGRAAALLARDPRRALSIPSAPRQALTHRL